MPTDRTIPVGNVYFDRTAAMYQKKREGTKRWQLENKVVSDLLGNLPDGSSVLDIPFGTGRFVPYYRAKNMAVTGIDISPHMIVAAEDELGDGLGACQLEVGSALNIQYPDRSFDLVVCVRFIQNIVSIAEARIALAEMSRVARNYLIVECELRKDTAPPCDIVESQPMRGSMYRRDVVGLLERAKLSLNSAHRVCNHGESEYFMLLCSPA